MSQQQNKIIEFIEDRAKEIGETVGVEKSEGGHAFITIEGNDCYMFVILGKRGGVKSVYYRDTLGLATSKEGSEASTYWVRSFFNSVERQRGRSELNNDDLADLEYIAKQYLKNVRHGNIDDRQIDTAELSDLVRKLTNMRKGAAA